MANRRYDRALGLAQRFGGRAVSLRRPARASSRRADIVVSSTGAPHQILGREELEFVASARMGRPLVLIDLAVPRDIEPERARLPGHRALRHGRPPAGRGAQPDVREAEAERGAGARARGGRALRALARLARRGAHDLGAARAAATRSWSRCCARTSPRWESLSEADRERLEVMARAVVTRLLHEPTLRLKDAAGDARRTAT